MREKNRRCVLLGALLITNLLMATRIPFSRSFQPLLKKRIPHSHQYHHSLLYSKKTPKYFSKSHLCPLYSSSFSFCLDVIHHKSTSPLFSSSRSFTSSSSLSSPSMAAPQVDETPEGNPLLQDFDFPPFDVVEAKHVRPGIRVLLKNLVKSFDFFIWGLCEV